MNSSEKDAAIDFLKNYVFLEGCRLILDYLEPHIEGKLVRTFSSPEMLGPSGIAMDGNMLYVADSGSCSLIAFDIFSGKIVHNFDYKQLYQHLPLEVFVTGEFIVVTGNYPQFDFFQKGTCLHTKSVPYPVPLNPSFQIAFWGKFIYVLPLSDEFDVVRVFDFEGKFVQKLLIVHPEHKHQPKTRLIFEGNRFYLFETYKLLMGTFSHDSTVLLVEQINDWNPTYFCGAVASDEEIYCNVYLDSMCLTGCVTSRGVFKEIVSCCKNGVGRLHSVCLSFKGLGISDYEKKKVYLYQ
jgi:hypothetical protein